MDPPPGDMIPRRERDHILVGWDARDQVIAQQRYQIGELRGLAEFHKRRADRAEESLKMIRDELDRLRALIHLTEHR